VLKVIGIIMIKVIIKWCNTCKKKEDEFDNCDNCKKVFCYQCLGRIENHLYCEVCYRQKKQLKNTDQIIKTVKKVDVYQKDEKARKIGEKMIIYSWRVKRGSK